MPMREPILVINAGSSSVKFSVFETAADRSLSAGAHGQVEGIGISLRLDVADAQGRRLAAQPVPGKDHAGAIAAIHEWFAAHVGSEAGFDGVGHRVVHGGTAYSRPVLIDGPVIAALEALVPLAPLHEPYQIAAIRAISAAAPKVPQVACFDTAFHRNQPPLAQEFALPRALTAQGRASLWLPWPVLRVHHVGAAAGGAGMRPGKLVVAHLGNGASMCADRPGPQRRQHHGLHRRRRAADGNANRRARSRRHPLSAPA